MDNERILAPESPGERGPCCHGLILDHWGRTGRRNPQQKSQPEHGGELYHQVSPVFVVRCDSNGERLLELGILHGTILAAWGKIRSLKLFGRNCTWPDTRRLCA